MDDMRLDWIKNIVCKYLNVTELDAFDNLYERDAECAKTLYSFLAGARDNRCAIFYDTLVEEEVEIDIPESSRDSELNEDAVENGHSETEEKMEEASTSDVKLSEELVEGKEEEAASSYDEESDKESQKKFMKQLVKKTVLHICFNITEHVVGQRYVYLMLRKFKPIPFIEIPEEVSEIMQDHFDVGVINKHPLMNLLDVISLVYLPLLRQENSVLVTKADGESLTINELKFAQKEYVHAMENFFKHTNIIVDQLQKPFPFDLPYIPPGSTPEILVNDTSFIVEAEENLTKWNATLTELIDEISEKKPVEKNPFSEIMFWEKRRSELSVLTDHLSNQSLNIVLKTLEMANCETVCEFEKHRSNILKQLYFTKDNINYLMNLEPYLKDLQPNAPLSSAIQTIPPLMNIYKLLWPLSDYYGRAENMGRLIEGLGIVVEAKIVSSANVRLLFERDFEEIQNITDACCSLAKIWKASYLEQRAVIESFEGLQHWYYSSKTLFEKTDYMSKICNNLSDISQKVKCLQNILKPEMKMLSPEVSDFQNLEEKITALPKRIKYVDFDIFLIKHSVLWDNLVHWFERQCSIIKYEAKTLINKILNEESNFETSMLLIRSLNGSDVPHSIQQLINEKYDKILHRYTKEVEEVEHIFLKHKDNPPKYKGSPNLTSAIIWERHLLGKIKTPIMIFRADKDFLNTEKGHTVQDCYMKLARVLKNFECEMFETWIKDEAKNISIALQTSLLKKGIVNSYFYGIKTEAELRQKFKGTKVADMNYILNFPVELEAVMMNAGLLIHMGFRMPMEIINFISQEETFTALIKDLNIALFKLHSILGSLTFPEAKLLQQQLEVVWEEVEPGICHLTWASLGVSQFITKMKQATDFFGSIVHQVQQIGKEINKKINSLKSAKLLHFKKHNDDEISICQLFFEEAERQMNNEVANYVKIYHSILPLLYKLESLACHTNTGKAVQMKEYYRCCEIQILNALVEMIIENLDLLSWSLESLIFPYFASVFESQDKLVLASTEKAHLTFKTFLINCVKSTTKFKRWMDGTCIESTPHYSAYDDEEPFEYTYYSDVCLHPEIRKLILTINGRVQNFIKKQQCQVNN